MIRTLPCLLLLFASACASIEPISEEEMVEATPIRETVAVTKFRMPDREVMTFRGTWTGIPAGEARIETTREGDVYRSRASIETIGVVSVLYGVSFTAESEANAATKTSLKWVYETDLDDEKKVVVLFPKRAGKIVSVIRKPDEVDRVMVELPGAHDPLAMVAAVRSSDLTPGRSFTANIFCEKNVYLARVLVGGAETVEVPAGTWDAHYVRVDLRKVVEGVPEEDGRAIAVWLTADELRIPVRIDAETKVGRIKLSLTRYGDNPAADEDGESRGPTGAAS